MRKKSTIKIELGFSLIELLVTISIIALLAGISLFALQGARQNGRDGRRRVDLETIRSGLELYKSDCGVYPTPNATNTLNVAVTAVCPGPSTNTYIAQTPADPQSGRIYRYARLTTTTYELCSSLENGTGSQSCGGSTSCGTGITCNYKVTQP